VTAYLPFADHGRSHEPTFVTRIEDADGQVLASFEPQEHEALDPSVAYGVLDMMRGVVDEGTAVRLRGQYGARGDLAGKTGTTQNAADGWFVLLHPDLVMGAWTGFPSPAITFRSEYWGQGSHTALRVVGHFYEEADLPADARFQPPPGFALPSGGRLLAASGDGSDLRLEEHAGRDGLLPAGGFDDAGDPGEEPDLAGGESVPIREQVRGALEEGGGGEGQGAWDEDRPRAERGESRGDGPDREDRREAEPAQDQDTEELNRQARTNSRVKDYLERIQKQKKKRDRND
jgi:membrane peptidoglycan carboxypeptidase